MKAQEPRVWSRGRWALIITALFVAQVTGVFLFAERVGQKSLAAKARPTFHLVSQPLTSSQLAWTFFASDPTLFSGASLHSFSGPAWLCVAPAGYIFPDHDKPTNWLALDLSQLGGLPEAPTLPFNWQPEELTSSQAGPLLSFFAEESVRTQSVVRVEGDLARRALDLPEALPPFPSVEPLENSEVQIAVSLAGVVLSTRVLQEGHSGSSAADRKALEVARRLHFSPAPADAPQSVWGKLVIEWETIPPLEPAGNAPTFP